MSSLIDIWSAGIEKLRKKRHDGVVFSSVGRGSVEKRGGHISSELPPRLSQAIKSKLLQQSEECIDSETTLSARQEEDEVKKGNEVLLTAEEEAVREKRRQRRTTTLSEATVFMLMDRFALS
ncbi:hypothetical protein GW17_00048318 [Ensete ventricosum]|nr:hypothetical protein GW17_00048318 [Ensete ventricosum]